MFKLAQILSRPTTDFWNEHVLQNIDYARYLINHKWEVASAGTKIGLNPIILIKHDWSKFRPKAFRVYKEHFFGPEGKTKNPMASKEFNQMVNWHYRTEDHHNYKLELPTTIEAELESIADWYAVGKANANIRGLSFPNFKDWWNKHKESFLLNHKVSISAYNKIENELYYPI